LLKTNTSPQKLKPSRWFYVVGIVILIVGPVVSSVVLFSSVFSNLGNMAAEIQSTQVVVPGSSDITLQQTGKYTIFYEYRSMVGNRIYSTDENIPGIIVNIVSKGTGDGIPLSSASTNSSYSLGSRSGIGLFDFDIDEPGIYELSASYPAVQGQQEEQRQEIILAVIHSSVIERIFGSIMGIVASAMAIVFVPFIVGVAIIIITFLKRRKARAKAMALT
jgi:hypothetical protein